MTPRRIIAALAIVALVLGLFWLRSCSTARTAGADAKLSREQAGAAIQSGGDAVQTIGNQHASETAGDTLTQENDDAIRKADGAAAPVAAGVRDAGIASVCKREANRRDPKCVQHAAPR